MMLQVQILYVLSYDEDQVALVVLEDSNFLRKCQVVLGTPTINRAIQAMKESEMENAPEAWQSTQHTYEFANYVVQLDPEDYGMTMPTNMGENPTDFDELILLKNKTTILAFESIILHCHTCHTLQGVISPYSPTTGGGSTETSKGDARWGRDPPIPIPMVQCGGFGT